MQIALPFALLRLWFLLRENGLRGDRAAFV